MSKDHWDTLMVSLILVVLIIACLGYVIRPDDRPQPNTTKPVNNDNEPDFVYDGPIDLNDSTLSESTLLCEGERACEGIYDKYLKMLSEKLGPPTDVIHFDDEINNGSVLTSWRFPDGYEIGLISDGYSDYWRKKGKYPKITLTIINLEKSYRQEFSGPDRGREPTAPTTQRPRAERPVEKPAQKPVQKRESSDQTMAIFAYRVSQDVVKERLSTPSTAKFPSYVWDRESITVTHLGNQRYSIRAHVDAQNMFGAMVRQPYEITLQLFDGGRRYKVERLNMP